MIVFTIWRWKSNKESGHIFHFSNQFFALSIMSRSCYLLNLWIWRICLLVLLQSWVGGPGHGRKSCVLTLGLFLISQSQNSFSYHIKLKYLSLLSWWYLFETIDFGRWPSFRSSNTDWYMKKRSFAVPFWFLKDLRGTEAKLLEYTVI